AILSRELGVPVRVTWTRDDDIQHAYYHTVTAQYIKAGLKDGKVTAWQHRSVIPTIWSTFVKDDPGYGHKNEPSLTGVDAPEARPARGRPAIGLRHAARAARRARARRAPQLHDLRGDGGEGEGLQRREGVHPACRRGRGRRPRGQPGSREVPDGGSLDLRAD